MESEQLLAKSDGHIPSVTDDILFQLLKQVLSNQVTLLHAVKVGYSWRDE